MSLRRLVSVSSVVVIATGAAIAQPKNDAAPAADAASATGSALPAAGTTVEPIEDAPPADMEGRDENPDAPRGTAATVTATVEPVATKSAGYPVELALRPITLPANMSEVSIEPHITVSPADGPGLLRARYGITPKVQLGLTYVFGGVYDDPATPMTKDYDFHPGKAGGLDVTVLLKNWAAVRVGLPVFLDPFAMGLTIGVPLKFHVTDRFAIGGMDDLLNIALPFGAEFAPSFTSARFNAAASEADATGSTQSRGLMRFSGYGIYQQKANLAIIGQLAIELEDFAQNRGSSGFGGTTTSIHGGVSFSPKRFLDVGGMLGFDDLARMPDSFTLTGFAAVRI